MKTINNTSAIKGMVSALFICFALTSTALSSENNNLGKTSVPDAISSEKDIEMESWKINLGDWYTTIKAPDSASCDPNTINETNAGEAEAVLQKDIQVSEIEKDIEVENWMTDLSTW
jgi:hypothetical protein